MVNSPQPRSPANSETCWDLALAAAAHHTGGGRLAPDPVNHEIFQVSTVRALVEGILDGDTPYSELMQHGDFGVGTFNALDGEMVAVDGEFYHMYGDGSLTPVKSQDLTPFAAVTFFRGEAEVDVTEPRARDELLSEVDATVPSENLFYAIRVDGHFDFVSTRTVVRQRRPYPSLLAASGDQAEQRFDDIGGTLVGFRSPQYVQGMTVAGYHLHFVDDARQHGGHVLDFRLRDGTVLIDRDTDIHLELPTSQQFLGAHMDAQDVEEQIDAAENVGHDN